MRAGSSSTARQLGAIIVLATTIGLVLVDVLSPSVREWWGRHDFTTSVVAGMLVLLLTVLVADRVVSARQLRERSRAIAAQAAILMAQAGRTASVVSAVRDDPESRDAASEEVRTYMTMLLISAPVLMNAQLSLAFLEDAQRLGGELARALALAQAPLGRDTADRVGAAAEGVRASARPLLAILNADELMAAVTDGNAGADP